MNRPDDLQDVRQQLAMLAPREADAPTPAPQALARLQQRVHADKGAPLPLTRRLTAMINRRSALATTMAVLILVVAFTMPPVRALASDFLGLFRVQKFAPISVSPARLEELQALAEQGLYPGEFQTIDQPGPRQAVSALADARPVTGWQPQSVTALPQADRAYVRDGGRGQLTVDVESARAIMEAAGVDPALLPDSLDGAVVDVTIYPAVEQVWDSGLSLIQTEGPLVDYPDDVEPDALGQALLQLLGMSPDEARRVARSIDWNSTLVLPVPQDLATFSEVTVGGNSALALSSLDGRENSLMWQEEGMLFFLSGPQSVQRLQEFAESVR